MRARAAMAALLLLAGSTGAARAAEDGCAAFKWPITREQQAFAAPLPVLAGGGVDTPGMAAEVKLAPQAEVLYTVKPRRAPKASPSYGAELTGSVTQGGTYQVTLSDEAWIDLVQGGKVLRSSGFSGKAGCPGVRKSVRFALEPGPVTIAISDAPVTSLKLDLLPAE